MSAEAGAAEGSREAGFHPGHNPWAVAITVTMATFMEVLDTSIANVSLPHIAGNLSVSQDESTWVLTSYLVANAIVLPISGWVANRVGRKRFYMTCVALFTMSSFMCGMAPNLKALIFFRILQGIGGGGLGPSEQSILADTFPPAKRGMAFAIYGMAVVLAPAIGPTLGGWITDNYSWRWVFFINVPVGLLSLLLTHRMVKDPPWITDATKTKSAIDFVGLALIAIGLGSLEVVLDKGQEDDWFNSQFITGCAITAAVAIVAFVIWELRNKAPIVDMRLFKNRTFALSCAMMLVLGITLFGSTVLLPQFTQNILGWSATQAGRILSPGGVLIMLMMPFVGRIMGKVDTRYMLAFGFTLSALALFHMTHVMSTDMDFHTAVMLRLYQAAGIAFLFVPISTMAYTDVAPEQNNTVAGMINLMRNMGGDIGIAIVTTLAARRAQFHLSVLGSNVTAMSTQANAYVNGIAAALEKTGASTPDAHNQAMAALFRSIGLQATTLAYIDVIYVLAVFSALMIPLVFFMRKNTTKTAAAH